MRKEKLMHFSHNHPLREFKAKEEDHVVCSCCALELSGSAFRCINSNCDFLMHKSCTDLPQHIHHKSHPAHALTLDPNRNFLCNACGGTGAGFPYYCSICYYDLHVYCSSFPETVKREEHEHPLSLLYSIQNNADDVEMVCDVCDESLTDGCWGYVCLGCDFGTHLECKEAEEKKEKETEDEAVVEKAANSEPSNAVASALEVQQQLQLIQLRVEANRQQAQMIVDMGRNCVSLTGGPTYRYY